MLKENRGITMISLVVTVIVLMILASIATYSGISTVRDARYYDGIHQMKAMQAEVNNWYEQKKDGDESKWNLGKPITSSSKEEQCVKAYTSAKQNNLTGTDIGGIIRL